MKNGVGWIVLGVITVVLLAVQFLFVGGRQAAAQAEHDKVMDQIKALEFKSMEIGKVATKKDMESFGEYTKDIENELLKVGHYLRQMTDGLNANIEKGEIKSFSTGEIARQEDFANFMRREYITLLRDTEARMAATMEPRLAGFYAELYVAQEPDPTKEEAALAKAKEDARTHARYWAHIYKAEDLIPVRQDENFMRYVGQRWETWRKYLITRDILERVVSTLEVKVQVELPKRPLQNPDQDLAARPVIEFATPMTTEGWRFVEQISDFTITPAKLGSAQLGKSDPDATPDAESGPPMEEDARAIFHDEFVLSFTVVAHPAVIQELLQEIQTSKSIYYDPISVQITRFPESETMGEPTAVNLENTITALDVPISAYNEVPAVPMRTIRTLSWEPPVKAQIKFRIFRFRFTNTPNQDPEKQVSAQRE